MYFILLFMKLFSTGRHNLSEQNHDHPTTNIRVDRSFSYHSLSVDGIIPGCIWRRCEAACHRTRSERWCQLRRTEDVPGAERVHSSTPTTKYVTFWAR